MTNPRILVVEDDADAQDIVVRLLTHIHREVDVATSAEEAWDLLQQNSYAGALIDLALPEMDGLTLLRHIRDNSDTADLPCITYTAHHSSRVRKEAMELGSNGYLTKPFNEEVLVQEVLRVMGS